MGKRRILATATLAVALAAGATEAAMTAAPAGAATNESPVVVTGSTGWSAASVSSGTDNENTAASCAVTTSGGVNCWGFNNQGELGDGSTTDSDFPVAVELSTVAGDSDPVVPTGASGGAVLASADYHSCAVVNTTEIHGGLQCWGLNNNGELGNGTGTQETTPVQVLAGAAAANATTTVGGVSYLSGVTAVAAGDNGSSDTTCAVASGGAYCWGYNGTGQLGNGNTTQSTTPVAVTGLGSGVSSVSVGYASSCALLTSGGMDCWGYNGYGELGDTLTTQSDTPVTVVSTSGAAGSALSGVTSIGVGVESTCAVASGTVDCWGRNDQGQLGNGTTTSSQASDYYPVAVEGVGGTGTLTGATAVSGGYLYFCAVVSGGAACWGYDNDGQLGNGNTTSSTTPVRVLAVDQPSASTYYLSGLASSSFGALAVGSVVACARTTAGNDLCWGYNSGYGEVGDGSTDETNAPEYVNGTGPSFWSASSLSLGTVADNNGIHDCAGTTLGQVRCWGYGGLGGLGNGEDVNSNPSPTQIVLSTAAGGNPEVPATSTTYTSPVASGHDATCVVVNTASETGTVQCWGANTVGDLGNNGTGYALSEAFAPSVVEGVGGAGNLTGATAVATSGANANGEEEWSCAVVSGGVDCWGYNGNGELGNGTTINSDVPVVTIPAGSGVVDVTAGGDGATCALYSSGTASCWGYNQYGMLGNNTTTTEESPVPVEGVGGAGVLSGITDLSAGSYDTCAVASGAVYCWGYNADGELGNGGTTESNVPTPVSGDTLGATAVGVGDRYACAVVSGGVKCWGDQNGVGDLGNGTDTNSTTPVSVLGSEEVTPETGTLSGVSASAHAALSAGGQTACAALTAGTLVCWGNDAYGELGEGEVAQGTTSTRVSCSPTSLAVGAPTTCTATVTDTSGTDPQLPTGTVAFSSTDSDTSFTGSPCTLAEASSTSGTCSVTASPGATGTETETGTYDSAGGELGSSGSSASLTVSKASPSFSALDVPGASVPGASYSGISATLSGGASYTAPDGTISFYLSTTDNCSGGTLVGTTSGVSQDNVAYPPVSTTAAPTKSGTYYWYAIYSGDADNNAARSTCTTPMVVGQGSSSRLAFTSPPTDTTAGDQVPAFTVAVEDSYGNVETTGEGKSDNISLTVGSGTCTLDAGAGPVEASAGTATFSSVVSDTAGTCTLEATDGSNDLVAAATSGSFDVAPAAEHQLAFTSAPGSGTAGQTLPPVSVSVEDAFGNVETSGHAGSTDQITLSVASGPCVLAAGAGPVAASAGTASFTGLVSDRAGTCTLSAADSTDTSVAGATSASFSVAPAAAAQLAFVTGPSDVSAGSVMTPAVTVQVEDAFGNPVADSGAAVTLSISSGSIASGAEADTSASGLATFSSITIDATASGLTLVASAPGLAPSPDFSKFDVTPAAGAQLVFTSEPPSTGTAGTALAPSFSVSVEDSFGNLATGSSAPVTLVPSTGAGSFTGLSATASTGVATFASVTTTLAGDVTLDATSPGLVPATSSSIAVAAAAPAQLAFSVEPPAAGTAGQPLSPSFSVSVQDAYGNTDSSGPGSTDTVVLGVASGPAGAAVASGASASASGGVATFSSATLDVAGSFVLSASDQSDGALAAATSSPVVVSGAATSSALSSSVDPSGYLKAVTLSATVTGDGGLGSPTGTVDFENVTGGTGTGISGCRTAELSPTGPDTSVATCAWTPPASSGTGGVFQAAADYSGDPAYAASSSDSLSQQVLGSGHSLLALGFSEDPILYGGSVTLSAQLTFTSGTGTPSGTIDFVDLTSGLTLCQVPVTAGPASATCDYTPPAAGGSYPLEATYSGDDHYAFSDDHLSLSELGNQVASVLVHSNDLTKPATMGQTVVFSAAVTGDSGTPTGQVAYSIDGSPLSCVGGTTSAHVNPEGVAVCKWVAAAAGTYSVTASYSGDAVYAPAAPSPAYDQVVTGNVATATTAPVLATAPPALAGGAITVTAEVSAASGPIPAGNVVFNDTAGSGAQVACAEAPLDASGSASCSFVPYPGTMGGPLKVTAAYLGQGDDAPSAQSGALSLGVLGSPTLSTFTLSSNASPSGTEKVVSLTATLAGEAGTPTGTVTFADGGVPIACNGGTAAPKLAGSGGTAAAVCRYTPQESGAHAISADYAGDIDYAPEAAPAGLTQLVDGTTAVTLVSVSSSSDPTQNGGSATLTATVSGGSGTPTGTVAFKADVGGATTVICPAAALGPSAAGAAEATCAYDPGSTGGAGQQAVVTAVYSGDATYAAKGSSPFTQTEDGIAVLGGFSLSSNTNPSGSGKVVTFTATLSGASGAPTGTVAFADDGTTICAAAKVSAAGTAICHVAVSGAGDHQISAVYSGDQTYASAGAPDLDQQVG